MRLHVPRGANYTVRNGVTWFAEQLTRTVERRRQPNPSPVPAPLDHVTCTHIRGNGGTKIYQVIVMVASPSARSILSIRKYQKNAHTKDLG